MSPEILGPLSCLGAYLLGSIPFGLVFSHMLGAPDPRQARQSKHRLYERPASIGEKSWNPHVIR